MYRLLMEFNFILSRSLGGESTADDFGTFRRDRHSTANRTLPSVGSALSPVVTTTAILCTIFITLLVTVIVSLIASEASRG